MCFPPTNLLSNKSATCSGEGGISPSFIKAACAESIADQYKSTTAINKCSLLLVNDAGAIVKYVHTDSSLGLILPCSNKVCRGSKKPLSINANPPLKILIATGSPFLIYSQKLDNFIDCICSLLGSISAVIFSVTILYVSTNSCENTTWRSSNTTNMSISSAFFSFTAEPKTTKAWIKFPNSLYIAVANLLAVSISSLGKEIFFATLFCILNSIYSPLFL